jgi:hypothetical protein
MNTETENAAILAAIRQELAGSAINTVKVQDLVAELNPATMPEEMFATIRKAYSAAYDDALGDLINAKGAASILKGYSESVNL